jgi:8-oxo-dGTP pyrophosphatase MutT (NUDIX family)
MLRSPACELRGLIRARLAAARDTGTPGGDHVVAGLEPEPLQRPPWPAAVLVALIERPSGLNVLLTRRTEHLAHHPGQISFPGGRMEPQDDGPVATALRETHEEIGLGHDRLEILGQLRPYLTITGFLVTPVVGVISAPLHLRPDPREVDEVFEVPLSFVLDRRNHQRQQRAIRGRNRRYYVLPYRHYTIWGATAAMLVGLADTLDSDDPSRMPVE